MILAFGAAFALVAAMQAGPAPFGGRWAVRVEPAQCRLERETADASTGFWVDTMPGSDSYRVAIPVAGADVAESFGHGSLSFGPAGKVVPGLVRVTRLPAGVLRLTMQGLPAALPDDLAVASTVTIANADGVSGTAAFGGSDKAVATLRRCNADQLIEWGADLAQFEPGGTTPAALTPSDDWIPNGTLLRLAEQSRRPVIDDAFRLLVATDGTIGECHALNDASEPEFARTACDAVVGRRRFRPARNAAGAAVQGAATFAVSLRRQDSEIR
jgi:hypothetical protein